MTAPRRSTLRRAPAAKRRLVRSVLGGNLIMPAGELDALDVIGVVINDIQGLTHLRTFGTLSVRPTTLPVAAATVVRWAFAARKDTTAVANLASVSLVPLRDFTAAGANVSDVSWRSRQYRHAHYLAAANAPTVVAGETYPKAASAWINWSTGRLGTLDQGEGWYLYMKNSGSISVTLEYDLITDYLLP